MDTQTAWALGFDDGIFLTTDGGRTWHLWMREEVRIHKGKIDNYYPSICANGGNTAWAGGYEGKLVRTVDGGKSWIPCYSEVNARFNAIESLDAMHAWVVGSQGTVMETADGGENWLFRDVPTDSDLIDISLFEKQIWISGGEGTVIKSTDGGSSWQAVGPGIEEDLISISNGGKELAWAATASGKILRTTDGGASWNTVLERPGLIITDISVVEDSIAWVVGFPAVQEASGGANLGLRGLFVGWG